jgi:hypothetical protein
VIGGVLLGASILCGVIFYPRAKAGALSPDMGQGEVPTTGLIPVPVSDPNSVTPPAPLPTTTVIPPPEHDNAEPSLVAPLTTSPPNSPSPGAGPVQKANVGRRPPPGPTKPLGSGAGTAPNEDCSTPYYFDNGIKRYKPACLQQK